MKKYFIYNEDDKLICIKPTKPTETDFYDNVNGDYYVVEQVVEVYNVEQIYSCGENIHTNVTKK